MKLAAWDELPRGSVNGSSYRSINPEGSPSGQRSNEVSETGRGARQPFANLVTAEKLETLRVPTLLMYR